MACNAQRPPRFYHRQVTALSPFEPEPFLVDELMADVIQSWWKAGIETVTSCQGGPDDFDPDGGVYERYGVRQPIGYLSAKDPDQRLYRAICGIIGRPKPSTWICEHYGDQGITIFRFSPEVRSRAIEEILLPVLTRL